MHDDLLERRLRDALHREADGLAFTITSAELDRRLALRSRVVAGRRSTLLLAAAVALGLLGLGGLLGALGEDDTESPPPSQLAEATPRDSGPTRLGTLDQVIADAIGNEVVLAQAHDHVDLHGNVDALPDRVAVTLGRIASGSRYQLTVACLGGGVAAFDIRVPASRGPQEGPEVACDGAFYTQPIDAFEPLEIGLIAPRVASWRVVVRRLEGGNVDPGPPAGPLVLGPGHEELFGAEDRRTPPNAPGWRDSGLVIEEVGSVPGRMEYAAATKCAGGGNLRVIFGHDLESGLTGLVATTETLVPCDGDARRVTIGIPAPAGSQLYVAAAPGTEWSILVSAQEPPIAVAAERPGWQLQVAHGPDLSFEAMQAGFSAPGVDGGGPILLVFACAGTAPIEVIVEVGRRVGDRQETLIAECTPEGAESAQSFELETGQAHVTYTAPVGTWTAITILVPDPLPE